MVNIYDKKNNAPYYIVGSLATLALLASGVFAAAPAILTALPSLEFLAPVVTLALSLGTPLIAVCAVFSAVVIALSYNAVSKNKALAKQEAKLADKTKEIEAQNKTLAEQETQVAKQKDQLTGKAEEIEAANEAIAEQETQLAEKDRKLKDKDVVISYVEEQLAGKDVVISEMKDQLARKAREIEVKSDLYEALRNGKLVFAPELSAYLKASLEQEKLLMKMSTTFSEPAPKSGDEMAAESAPDAQEDERTVNGMEAQSAPVAQPVETPKQTGSGWFSSRQVWGAGIAAMLGSAGLLAQCFIGPVANALPTANDFTGVDDLHNDSLSILGAGFGATDVDDLHNDSFSISEAGIVATFGFMGLLAQCFIGSIPSVLSLANKPINSVSPPANSFNPETTLDKELNQINDTLEAAEGKANEDFDVDPNEHNFINDKAPEEFTLPQANGTVVEGSTQVGQNDSIQAKEAVIEGKVGQNESANSSPAPGLQGIALSHQSIPRSAPPSGP